MLLMLSVEEKKKLEPSWKPSKNGQKEFAKKMVQQLRCWWSDCAAGRGMSTTVAVFQGVAVVESWSRRIVEL